VSVKKAALIAVIGMGMVWRTASTSLAHFLVLLPSQDVVEGGDARSVALHVAFTHPMEQGPVMEMALPRQFGVLVAGKRYDLLETLEPRSTDGKTAYVASARMIRPGDHVFFLDPAPYWEPAEGKMIVHHTKVVVNFMGLEEGWDARVGSPVEIEPLVRPYGLWTGNAFRGIVRRDGQPVPFAEIEVEYYNQGGRVAPPNDAFITQVIKADAGGVFSYAMPRAGWWGFAALVDGDRKMANPDGEMVDVELGGLMWVKTVDME
jgi:cobalt/nickel transport protein